MKKYIIFGLLIIIFSGVYSQEIRYVNEGDFKTLKSVASHYLVIHRDSTLNKYVFVQKYKIDNTLLEEGFRDKHNLKKYHGTLKRYSDNKLEYIENYKKGKLNGELIGYYKDGNIRRKEFYKKNKMIPFLN